MENTNGFHLDDVIHHLKEYLPAQAPLKDFVHHNTLHAFQSFEFHEALSHASSIFGYRVYLSLKEFRKLHQNGAIPDEELNRSIANRKGPYSIDAWRKLLLEEEFADYKIPRIGFLRSKLIEFSQIDFDVLVHPILFRIIGSYLDQGIATWNFPAQERGLLASIRAIEHNGLASFFNTKKARLLLFDLEANIPSLLKFYFNNNTKLYQQYLFDQQFAHPGWSGMFAVLEDQPVGLLDQRKTELKELIQLELLLELDQLFLKYGEEWKGFDHDFSKYAKDLFQINKLSVEDELNRIWQEAYEWTYYHSVLNGILDGNHVLEERNKSSFQALFCIDDRECSIRRHVENVNPSAKTFGTAGFFNVAFYFQPFGGKFYTKSCPAPMDPNYLIQEVASKSKIKQEIHFNKRTNSLFLGWILTHSLGIWSGLKLAWHIFFPGKTSTQVSSFKYMNKHAQLTIKHEGAFSKDGKQIGFTVWEMADRLEELLRTIGLTDQFAPLIYFVGHGSSSLNNTYYAGYDCGACSGRPGSVNARVIASIANYREVRDILFDRGITIPQATQFVGALHDTSRDEMEFYDLDVLTAENQFKHAENAKDFTLALQLNAKERSRRFKSIKSHQSAKKVQQLVQKRTVSFFEPRPELNHATNALCVVGQRSFVERVFLDRRAFLNSYDYLSDQDGRKLLGILNAVAPVCGGINLEYYFSRLDQQHLGAGTKLPHNVVGLFGVANGTDGDLRTGLPSQMIEVHDPLRLMVIVEQFPEVVLNILKVNLSTYAWFDKNWIHLMVYHPKEKQFYRFESGQFVAHEFTRKPTPTIENMELLFESTSENIPVQLIKN